MSRTNEYVLDHGMRVTVLTTGEETDGRHDLVEAQQAGGSTTPLHLHTRYEERLWVIEGSLTVWAGDDVAELRSGDYYRVPMNVPHTIRIGGAGCRALNITSPAGFAELVVRTGTPAALATTETELDVELFMAVTTELGDVVLGPPGTLPGDVR